MYKSPTTKDLGNPVNPLSDLSKSDERKKQKTTRGLNQNYKTESRAL